MNWCHDDGFLQPNRLQYEKARNSKGKNEDDEGVWYDGNNEHAKDKELGRFNCVK